MVRRRDRIQNGVLVVDTGVVDELVAVMTSFGCFAAYRNLLK